MPRRPTAPRRADADAAAPATVASRAHAGAAGATQLGHAETANATPRGGAPPPAPRGSADSG
eukprot:359703-Chlamydomonas_euryale.AAC.2